MAILLHEHFAFQRGCKMTVLFFRLMFYNSLGRPSFPVVSMGIQDKIEIPDITKAEN